jgi:hypothetical protein
VFIFCGCQTGYNPQSYTGGYKDIPTKEYSIFSTTFSGNGYTSEERTLELAQLRNAEKAWRRGYKYFVDLKSGAQMNRSGSVNTATAVPVYGGGAIAVGSSIPMYKPSGGSTIRGYALKPKSVDLGRDVKIYNTLDFIEKMSDKHSAKINVDITDEKGPINDFERFVFKQADSVSIPDTNHSTEITDIKILDLRESSIKPKLAVMRRLGLVFLEFPYPVLADSEEFLKKIAKKLNSDVVSVSKQVNKDTNSNGFYRNIYWVEIGKSYNAVLGVNLEPNLLKSKIFQVRSFDGETSQFKLGDKILEINGFDTLNLTTLGEAYYQRQPGDKIKVKVNRNGELKTLNVTLKAPEAL